MFCLYACHVISRCSIKTTERMKLAFGTEASFDHTVFYRNSGTTRTTALSKLCTLLRHSIYVDYRDIFSFLFDNGGHSAPRTLSTVVGRTTLTVLATINVQVTTLTSLSLWASFSVHSTMHVMQRVVRVHLRLLIIAKAVAPQRTSVNIIAGLGSFHLLV